MKKIIASLLVVGLGLTSAIPSFAGEKADGHKVLKVDTEAHYEGEAVKDVPHAFDLLNEKTTSIAALLDGEEELEVYELEEIHEATYSLETAVDFLNDEGSADKAEIASLDEAVQAIHYASENQEEAIIREWFLKLQPSVVALQSGDKDKAAEVKPVKQEFYTIVIKDHKFNPEEIVVPAGEKVKLIVDNQDPTPEEFESHDMNREKIIRGNRKATIYIGPLKPGKYHFFGEFNMDTANGHIIAK